MATRRSTEAMQQKVRYRKSRRDVSSKLALTQPTYSDDQSRKSSTVNKKEFFGRCRKNPPGRSSKNDQTPSATAIHFPLPDEYDAIDMMDFNELVLTARRMATGKLH